MTNKEMLKKLIEDFNSYSELVALNYSQMKEGNCDEGTVQWNRGHLYCVEEYLTSMAEMMGIELVWERREHTFAFDDWKRQLEYRTVSAIIPEGK